MGAWTRMGAVLSFSILVNCMAFVHVFLSIRDLEAFKTEKNTEIYFFETRIFCVNFAFDFERVQGVPL